jgi:nucleoside-diphosphate-sugar epimerase
VRELEDAVTGSAGLEGVALRYGGLYGPGTEYEAGGAFREAVRRGLFRISGDGAGIWSLVHVDDAAAATVAALDRGAPGIYNIVDDDPAPVSVWAPAFAEAVGGPPPPTITLWIGRLASGDYGVAMMTEIRGASNEKAKRELGWTLRYPSWRQGFAEVYGRPAERPATTPSRTQRPSAAAR